MATYPSLVEALAPHDGRSVATLIVVGNHLRASGLIDGAGARGRGAIHVSHDDAAALVLAGLWTDSPAASPRAVEMLASLKRRPAPEAPNLPRCLGLVVRLANFGEMVGALLEYGYIIRKELDGLSFELTVTRPVPTARLELVDYLGLRRTVAEWCVDAERLTAGFYLPETSQRVDRRHATTISSDMLWSVADVIRGNRAEARA